MDASQRKKSIKGPPLPCRLKLMQQIQRNRSRIATVITPNSNDGAASDTDSGYEYVANPMKKRNRSAVDKSTGDQRQQNRTHGNEEDCKSQPKMSNNADQTKTSADPTDCRKIGKLDLSLFDKPIYSLHTSKKEQSITETFPIHADQQQTCRLTYPGIHEDIISSGNKGKPEDAHRLEDEKDTRSCNQDLSKHQSSSKGLHLASDDNILYKRRSQQEIPCSYKGNKNYDGYQKLIKEAIEPTACTHEYQKLDKLTMEPHSTIAEPRCSKVHHHTF